MIQVNVPVLFPHSGGVLIPAAEVTTMLRRVAISWVDLADDEDGATDFDPETVRALAGALGRLADQIDVECIAFASDPPRTAGPAGGE
ncbi:hypothetical protein F7Q99_32990 [Streptomyces kaniharaensis]|uniref:Uncharacterized protein n=1 Tax=Streptomyces kaniharaensis TaxID=212423 RepID=A0A6N7KYV8_9ACTN|nr:DUF6213 family protein [Streptomyces kaniharaensis]MQS16876.1 hypothetical protein [Streptomyces kaniharaensis]